MSANIEKLTQLFEESGKAHHEAFSAVHGDDPEWAAWYANFLVDRLAEYLGTTLNEAELANWLTHISKEHSTKAPGAPWQQYYAEALTAQYGST